MGDPDFGLDVGDPDLGELDVGDPDLGLDVGDPDLGEQHAAPPGPLRGGCMVSHFWDA